MAGSGFTTNVPWGVDAGHTQLLMLSGVGPLDALAEHGVDSRSSKQDPARERHSGVLPFFWCLGCLPPTCGFRRSPSVRSIPARSAAGRFGAFAKLSEKDRFLRIAVIHCVMAA